MFEQVTKHFQVNSLLHPNHYDFDDNQGYNSQKIGRHSLWIFHQSFAYLIFSLRNYITITFLRVPSSSLRNTFQTGSKLCMNDFPDNSDDDEDVLYADDQGGIFTGNLGTRFSQNP